MIRIVETKEWDKKGIIMGTKKYEAVLFWTDGDYASNIFSDEIYDMFVKRNRKTADMDYSIYSSEVSYSKVKGNCEGNKCVIMEKTGINFYDSLSRVIKNKPQEEAIEILLNARVGVSGKTDYILNNFKDKPLKGIYYLSRYNNIVDSVNIWMNGKNVNTSEVDKSIGIKVIK